MKPSHALSNSHKYTTSLVPKNSRLMVFHLHNGNDPDGTKRRQFCQGKKVMPYVTVAKLMIDVPTPFGMSTDEYMAWAVCNKKDTPNRRLGHEIAVGRVIKEYLESING